MRRLARILVNVATVMSLVLCMMSAALWARSYGTSDSLAWIGRHRTASANSDRGGITVEGVTFSKEAAWVAEALKDHHGWHRSTESAGKTDIDARFTLDPGVRRHWHTMGFRWFVSDGGTVSTGLGTSAQYFPRRAVGVPHGALVFAFAIAPAWWFRRRPRRVTPGCCPDCGYDLRATPERCPECGRGSF